MQLKFLEENYGIGKTSQKPYHLLKLADPETYENHTISYDPLFITPGIQIARGTLIELNGRLSTPFQNTGFVATTLKIVQDK